MQCSMTIPELLEAKILDNPQMCESLIRNVLDKNSSMIRELRNKEKMYEDKCRENEELQKEIKDLKLRMGTEQRLESIVKDLDEHNNQVKMLVDEMKKMKSNPNNGYVEWEAPTNEDPIYADPAQWDTDESIPAETNHQQRRLPIPIPDGDRQPSSSDTNFSSCDGSDATRPKLTADAADNGGHLASDERSSSSENDITPESFDLPQDPLAAEKQSNATTSGIADGRKPANKKTGPKNLKKTKKILKKLRSKN